MESKTTTAIIVGVQLQQDEDFAYSMEELRNLAAACGIETVGEVTQKAAKTNAAHYIGSGKLKELAALADHLDVSAVIFDGELSPSQIRNLERKLGREVLDRTMLILHIFAERAKTKEAQLQVEIARLQYMLSRLSGQRDSLGRQGGGSGLKNRGTGETKLELDRRASLDRIASLQDELERLVARRQIQRKQRGKNEIPVVCLVGYTNAGKSSMLNAIMDYSGAGPDKHVLARNMLFATLETSVRRITLPDKKTFLLTDTVGFVSRLPHHLVKAFRSTLEEIAEADLLIHVADYANPKYKQQMEVTRETLSELGVDDIPMIYAYNKADLTESAYPLATDNGVIMSAAEGSGLNELMSLIRGRIFTDYVSCEMLIPFDQGSVVSYFNEHARVQAVSYEENGTRLEVECRKADFERFRDVYLPLHSHGE
ncbi:GTPase HflX [Paenibacillus sp. HN-1]|uniref:GTPase HflX n=1 Tax=Paenibacillus TaxID=44249 RepID=UPI001CA94885|nr:MULTISPECIES: GTPase HflX [Paenibacillus]MBY9080279.1 GTPase HflX [Paenibacillus sp. CGMCC 1.18879]MBY9083062.1 GTPase HflX [Paenibacillus sinensis]